MNLPDEAFSVLRRSPEEFAREMRPRPDLFDWVRLAGDVTVTARLRPSDVGPASSAGRARSAPSR
jgi:hypothetical protein